MIELGRKPMLFQKDKQGRIKTWETYVTRGDDGGILINTEHGLLGGNITKDAGVAVTAGKNEGKKNATTTEDQALSEMGSAWELKCSKGYVDNMDHIDRPVIRPMLANKWPERKKYIKFPAIAQRKYDGVRCDVSFDDRAGRASALSRLGNAFPHLDHIRTEMNNVLRSHPEAHGDGELYSEDLDFNTLVGLVKRHELTPEDQQLMLLVKYRVYDSIVLDDANMGFQDRWNLMDTLVRNAGTRHVTMVENFIVNSEEEIYSLHAQFVGEGYEGIIIRNIDGKYAINHRSNDLLKYKHFETDEFKIVGFEEAVGNDVGTVVWECAAGDKKFTCRMKATRAVRRQMLEEAPSYVGKKLTVNYQNLSPEGVPRFPVGIAIRDYE